MAEGLRFARSVAARPARRSAVSCSAQLKPQLLGAPRSGMRYHPISTPAAIDSGRARARDLLGRHGPRRHFGWGRFGRGRLCVHDGQAICLRLRTSEKIGELIRDIAPHAIEPTWMITHCCLPRRSSAADGGAARAAIAHCRYGQPCRVPSASDPVARPPRTETGENSRTS
jgi:hypothetical protein